MTCARSVPVASARTRALRSAGPPLRPAAIPRAAERACRRGLLVRFLAVEVAFGLGAGSFLPFVNLFFADRFGVPFAALGVVLGTLAVAGSLGALAHGRLVVPRLGSLRGMVVTEAASLPFALAAAFAPLPLAVTLLAARTLLMYGSSATLNAYTLSSFTPAERAGASDAPIATTPRSPADRLSRGRSAPRSATRAGPRTSRPSRWGTGSRRCSSSGFSARTRRRAMRLA